MNGVACSVWTVSSDGLRTSPAAEGMPSAAFPFLALREREAMDGVWIEHLGRFRLLNDRVMALLLIVPPAFLLCVIAMILHHRRMRAAQGRLIYGICRLDKASTDFSSTKRS